MGHRTARPWSPLLAPHLLERWVLFSHLSPRWAGTGVAGTRENGSHLAASWRGIGGVVCQSLFGDVYQLIASLMWWMYGATPMPSDTEMRSLVPQVQPHMDNQALAARPIFMQDGASCHTARLCRNFLEIAAIDVQPWPSLSPDLNVIEHLWDFISRTINATDNQPRTAQEFRDAVRELWGTVTRIRRLARSCHWRVWAVIAAEGDVSRYWVGYICDIIFCWVFVLFYLMVDFVLWQCHSKIILIPDAFIDSLCLGDWWLYLLMACCSVVWFADWLVGWLMDWLVDWLLNSGTSWMHAWRYCDYITQWFHSPALNSMESAPGCKWASKIWRIAHCLRALGRDRWTYTYDISQIRRKWYRSISELRNCWFFTCIRVK